MVAKVLAVVMTVAVLSLGAFAYYHHTGCCPLSGDSTTPAAQSTGCTGETPPCCQTPSRTSLIALTPGEGCCDDVHFNAPAEVLTIQPREVQ